MYFRLCRDREDESETHQDNAEANEAKKENQENNDSSHKDLANEYANICGLLFLVFYLDWFSIINYA